MTEAAKQAALTFFQTKCSLQWRSGEVHSRRCWSDENVDDLAALILSQRAEERALCVAEASTPASTKAHTTRKPDREKLATIIAKATCEMLDPPCKFKITSYDNLIADALLSSNELWADAESTDTAWVGKP